MTPDPASTSKRPAHLWALAVLVAAGGAVFWAFGDMLNYAALQQSHVALVTVRDAMPVVTALLFVLLYAGVVALSLPGATVMTLTGGFLFGIWPGAGLNVVAATLGATLLFLAFRFGLGRALAARIDASEGRMARVKQGLDRNQWSMLFFIRLAPVIPFFAANLLPALLDVPLRRFVISTFFGILPAAVVFTSVGAGLGKVLLEEREPDLGIIFEAHVFLPLLGLAVLSLLPVLLRRRAEG